MLDAAFVAGGIRLRKMLQCLRCISRYVQVMELYTITMLSGHCLHGIMTQEVSLEADSPSKGREEENDVTSTNVFPEVQLFFAAKPSAS